LNRVTADYDAVEQACGEATWRKLPFGVQLKMRPATGLISATVEAQVARELFMLQQGEDVLTQYGFEAEEVGLLADEQISIGFVTLMRAAIRGKALIEEWNLDDRSGEPVPITLETLRKFFHLGPIPGSGPLLLLAFNRLCDAPDQALVSEKNGSGSSPNGASAEERNTAQIAAPPEKPAPSADGARGSSARKSNTRPKPRKG
jgi:hypothetical protein